MEHKKNRTPAQPPAKQVNTGKTGSADSRRTAREWVRIHGRRLAHLLHDMLAIHRSIGPASFLLTSFALGAALTITTLYSTSYAVTMDGEAVGVVAEQAMVQTAIEEVEAEGEQLLGYDYQVEGELDYDFTLTLKSRLNSQEEIANYFYTKLDSVSDHLKKFEVLLDGESVGVVKDEAALKNLFAAIQSKYVNENTVSADFVEDLQVKKVFVADNVLTMEEMEAALTANSTGETTYTVVKGDTYSGIAHRNDMSLSELMALNPTRSINVLRVGEVINVKEEIPLLSVKTTERQYYEEEIPCPVQTRDNPNMYVGDSKVIVQGDPGLAKVEADVVYVNGYERERTVLSSETVEEPTVTVKEVGTKPKPKTASKGYYKWPIQGRITSYFGGRYIFGSYSYHGGIDIKASYGAAVKAADGGTVTFAGTKGTYGKLVIIKHDNGTQTYYGHNSSLLVRAGEKVYQGQTIAKAGSTGRSTGVHCHFEIRINGKAVNPLNYLP